MASKLKSFIIFLLGVLGINCQDYYTAKSTLSLTPHVDLVYPLLDAANSRWFYFASASRPFGMVGLNPDTQLGGAWGSGYRYDTDTIKGFSHIHAWQMSGVSILPISFSADPESYLSDYFSPFEHGKEIVEVGYHKILLDRYNIQAELTSSKRVGFHRYHFIDRDQPGIVVKLAGILGPCTLKDGSLKQLNDSTLIGQMANAPTRRRPKDLIVYFTMRFDHPIQSLVADPTSENQIITFQNGLDSLQLKVGVSYTSNKNATQNLETEIPHWDFNQVVQESKEEWELLLGRVEIEDNDRENKQRFYTDLWHALHGRKIISDVNGQYPDNTQDTFRIGQIPLNEQGRPKHNHYNSDSFWGAQWTLNTLWGMLYPEIMSEFVQSLIVYYKDGGMIPRGPSGGNYTYVMTGASSTPFIVSAYQKGIRDIDVEEIYGGLKFNHSTEGIMAKAGYEHNTLLGGGMKYYEEKGWVPHPIPEGSFGYHQDGASLTMEYAYQDWALAQMAKALDKQDDYTYYLKRSNNYKNVFDAQTNWMRPKDMSGNWYEPFDPYQYEHGFNESNAAQSTWFVPHDLIGLAELMGGKKAAVEKLNAQFEEASNRGFTAGNSHERGEDPSLARIPINYGNQPSMQTGFIFNYLDRPDLCQYWIHEIREKAFSGLTPYDGYNGDEDQGLMGALSVLLKLGMFQMNGGVEENPIYSLTTPLFNKITLNLPNGKTLLIQKFGAGKFIDRIEFNGNDISVNELTHKSLINGGILGYYVRE